MPPSQPRTKHAPHGNEYGDPPRRWRRVAAFASSWIAIIALSAVLAPVIAASGAPADPRDLPPESANDAIHRFLYYSESNSEATRERAWNVVCEGATPELDPDDLHAMVADAYDRIGGAEGVEIQLLDDEATTPGETRTVPVIYSATAPMQGRQEQFELTVSARPEGGTWCVVDATLTPTPPDRVPIAVMGRYFEAIDSGDLTSAVALQCSTYSGMTPEEIAEVTLPIISSTDHLVYRDPLSYEAVWTAIGDGADLVRLGHDYVEVWEYNEKIIRASFVGTVESQGTVETACIASVHQVVRVGIGN
jgi:hypothetical protein